MKKAEKGKLRFLTKMIYFTSKTSAPNHPEGVREEGEGANEEVEASHQEGQLASNFETRFGFHYESACKLSQERKPANFL